VSAWLVDIYVLATVLMLAGIAGSSCFYQPAQRLAVMRSIAAGLGALVLLTTVPGWPRVSRTVPASNMATLIPRTGVVVVEPQAAASPRAEPEWSREVRERPTAAATLDVNFHPMPNSSATMRSTGSSWSLSWFSIVGTLFLCGMVANLVWLALGAIQATRLRRSMVSVSSRVQLLLARIAGEVPGAPSVGQSARISLPMALGLARPVIVLPEGFAESEPDNRLEVALAHEWAHIHNGDLRWLALLRLLNLVLFVHPLFWWLRQSIRADQEALADAAAAMRHGDGRLAYAETLIDWARSSRTPHRRIPASAALALWDRPSQLQRRVRLLLDCDFPVEATVPRRWRWAVTGLGLVGALALSLVTMRPVEATAQVTPARAMEDSHQAVSSPDKDTPRRFEYAGRVLDPDGQPVSGAKLRLTYQYDEGPVPPIVRATTDEQGRFRFMASGRDFKSSSAQRIPWKVAQIVAAAEGFGIGSTRTYTFNPREPIDPLDLTIRLVPDDDPIEGRILDLEGRPIPGVNVLPVEVKEPQGGTLSAWLDVVRQTNGGSSTIERQHLGIQVPPGVSPLPPVTTDELGRFTLRGLGRERLIRLKIQGSTVQTKTIRVMTRKSEPISVNPAEGNSSRERELCYGARFDYAAAPTKPIVGIVRDQDSGKPLPGVLISDHESAHRTYNTDDIQMTSDSEGRYRLVGLPAAGRRRIFAFPAPGQPYLPAAIEVPRMQGLEPVALEILLKRGILIQGHVLDQKTGEPQEAWVFYHAHRDNPSLARVPGFRELHALRGFLTGPDGRFQVVGLPGRGLLATLHIRQDNPQQHYQLGVGLDHAISPDTKLPIVPARSSRNLNTLMYIDLPPDTATVEHNLFLQPGLTVKGRVVDPQGQPLAGARIFRITPPGNGSGIMPDSEFAVEGLRPGEERELAFFHDANRLAATATVRGGDRNEVVIQLQPWASLTGRLLDEEAHPQGKVLLMSSLGILAPREIGIDGRFRYEPIIPGSPTEVTARKDRLARSVTIASDLVLRPGETRDLGDVKVTLP
jgi:beta-lactamase regulating signal transducer with metallopeptidase domain